jgi:hypothetical protein
VGIAVLVQGEKHHLEGERESAIKRQENSAIKQNDPTSTHQTNTVAI